MWTRHRLFLIAGHFGSGKTELSVNLALHLAGSRSAVSLVDLDVVNPYFRARDQMELLKNSGISVISSNFNHSDTEIPGISPNILAVLQNPAMTGIIDLGGDPMGPMALQRFLPHINKEELACIFVLNANRPQTGDLESACTHLRKIQAAMSIPFTGIINNTHLCGETTSDDIRRGEILALQVGGKCSLPVYCSVVSKAISNTLSRSAVPCFLIEIHMKKPWEF